MAEYQKEQLQVPRYEQQLCLVNADLNAERLRAESLEKMLRRTNAELRQVREEKRVAEREKADQEFSHSFAGSGSLIQSMVKLHSSSQNFETRSGPPVFCF